MLFNSFEFAVFLPIVFVLYWFIFNKSIKLQNALILVVSYVFYGWWDWRFLTLIFISSLCDFFLGRTIYSSNNKNIKKTLLTFSLVINLGFLGFFKYYNFFIDNFATAISNIGFNPNINSLKIILPVGISFYTFQTLSYTFDIYNNKLKPTNDFVSFFAFVSFFPQLVAGPIERAKNLLPQFYQKRIFNYENSVDGLRQILWGLAKKVIIADTCAINVDYIFSNYDSLSGGTLLLGAFYFAFQIYCDFSGYSDIAIGTAKLLGFNLMQNFNLPYFSRDIAEFWRRWHISLSTWFRDYVYIPLGGSYGNKLKRIRNIIIVFTVSGFWHGANWTFIIWGLLNGLYYIPIMLRNKQKKNTEIIALNRTFPSFKETLQIIGTFSVTLIAWVFFRSKSVYDAINYLSRIFTKDFFSIKETIDQLIGNHISYSLVYGMVGIILLVTIEWFQRDKKHGLEFNNVPKVIRWSSYWILGFGILWFMSGQKSFIYFQF